MTRARNGLTLRLVRSQGEILSEGSSLVLGKGYITKGALDTRWCHYQTLAPTQKGEKPGSSKFGVSRVCALAHHTRPGRLHRAEQPGGVLGHHPREQGSHELRHADDVSSSSPTRIPVRPIRFEPNETLLRTPRATVESHPAPPPHCPRTKNFEKLGTYRGDDRFFYVTPSAVTLM
jgi:hypothetical protein